MRTILLTLLFTFTAFSQGIYLSKESGFSAGFLYGHYGYQSDNKIGFAASYTYLGVVELSYARSTILSDDQITNFQDEYFIRAFGLKGNRFFISAALGYQRQEIEDELWKNYPLKIISKGLSIEAGLHLTSIDKSNPKFVVSIFYRYFEPTTDMQTPEVSFTNVELARAFTFDMGIVYYFGQLGLIIGPRLVLDQDFEFPFYGLNLSLMLMH